MAQGQALVLGARARHFVAGRLVVQVLVSTQESCMSLCWPICCKALEALLLDSARASHCCAIARAGLHYL
jgi:hypothetical protein